MFQPSLTIWQDHQTKKLVGNLPPPLPLPFQRSHYFKLARHELANCRKFTAAILYVSSQNKAERVKHYLVRSKHVSATLFSNFGQIFGEYLLLEIFSAPLFSSSWGRKKPSSCVTFIVSTAKGAK